jgi:3-hydroxybutyryl-CoA dehydrogenase
MTNSYFFFLTKNHPLFKEVKNLFPKNQINILDQSTSISELKFALPLVEDSNCTLIDLTLFLDGTKKKEFLQKLDTQFSIPIISDLSCYDGESLLKKIPFLLGAMASSFPSPKKAMEFYASNILIKDIIFNLGNLFNLSPIEVTTPGFGFIYPRTLSLIINEAYFALEEHLATQEDIDCAMKFGVNYPLGPFEWAQTIGLDKIYILLNELLENTGQNRYRPSQHLYEEVKKSFSLH